MGPAPQSVVWDDGRVSGTVGDLSGIGGSDALVLGQDDGRKTALLVGWGTLVIVGLATIFVSLTMLDAPQPLIAVGAAAAVLVGLVGCFAAWRRRIVVDLEGVQIRRLRNRRYPWAAVERVAARRNALAVPTTYQQGFRRVNDVDYIETSIEVRLVLRDGREIALPIKVDNDSVHAPRLAELARALDDLRRRSSRR